MGLRHLVGLALVGLMGCGASPVDEGVDENLAAVVRPSTFVVHATPGRDVQVEAERLVFDQAGHADLLDRSAGDVLVCGDGDGFLRRVTSIERKGETIIVKTAAARLDEAIEQGRVNKRLTRAPETEASGSRSYATQMAPQGFGFPGLAAALPTVRLSGAGGEVEIVSGHVSYDPDVDVDLAVKGGRLERAKILARGQASAAMRVRFDIRRPFTAAGAFVRVGEPGWRLLSVPAYRSVVWVGQVPVVVIARLELFLGYLFEVGGDVKGEVAIDLTSAGQTGIELRDGTWRSLSTASLHVAPSAEVDVPQRTLVGDVTLTAQLSIALYDVAGPYLGVQAYAGVGQEKRLDHEEWFGQVGVRALAGVQGGLFGLTGGYQAVPFERQERIALGAMR